MKRFRYAADPLCVAACALYAVNRLLIKPHAGPGFFHDHFNDLLLIPAALPWLLWISRALGWRRGDLPPTWREVAGHTLLWAFICEGLGPRLFSHAGTADWIDVVAYFGGGALAWILWNRIVPAQYENPLRARAGGRLSS